MTDETLHEAYARLHRWGPEFGGEGGENGLSNHGPMAVEVLARRGLGEHRLSILALPGIPDPQALQALGVARLSHGPFPHRHALAALTAYAQPSTMPTGD